MAEERCPRCTVLFAVGRCHRCGRPLPPPTAGQVRRYCSVECRRLHERVFAGAIEREPTREASA